MQESTNSSDKTKNQSANGKTKLTDTIKEKTQDLMNINEGHHEGTMTKAIEEQTSKIPSGVYLSLAIGSMVLSAGCAALSKRKDLANFIGLWAPSILLLGIYNKIVKTQGSDMESPQQAF